MATTTTQIMEYVKIFMATAIDEKWTPEKIQQTWEEKTEDIKSIVEEGLPKKTKKESSTKDPNKPKRGRSAYIFFCSEARQGVKEELGDVKPQEVMRALGARWRELKDSSNKTDKAKVEKYTKMAEEDKERASKELDEYVPPTEEELEAAKPKRGRKTSKKKSDKPKRGRSAYIFFCSSVRPGVKNDNPDLDAKEITKLLSEMWSDLKEEDDSEDLQKYNKMAAADKERYTKEMETYVPSEDEDDVEKPKKVARKEKDVEATEEKPKKVIKVVKRTVNKEEAEGFKKFSKANRNDVKDDNPDMKPSEITKILRNEWAELDEEEKREWANEDQE